MRLKILPPGESKPLFADLYDETENVLIEAKGTTHRAAIRMALGQLADYKRFVHPVPTLAILLPARPRSDLLDLCETEGVKVLWPGSDGFSE